MNIQEFVEEQLNKLEEEEKRARLIVEAVKKDRGLLENEDFAKAVLGFYYSIHEKIFLFSDDIIDSLLTIVSELVKDEYIDLEGLDILDEILSE